MRGLSSGWVFAEVCVGPDMGLDTGGKGERSHRLYAKRIECGVNKTRMN